ncbi:hypothetical protein LCGC14_2354760 [marine sediment metagenome]|uniref:Homing endonuclease LAGLIDADG domain-containing protein n=1 Tax=marine sediment metagenome TaxID=412755 RepID=A0A0F9EKW2_9ZZZZ
MIKLTKIAWLAGLLEGEGYFGGHKGKYPRMVLKMTDEDVVTEVAAMWGTTVVRSGNCRVTQINGARAIQWMMTLYPFLYKYRREKIVKIIKFWKALPKSTRARAKCHPDRLMEAHDLCKPCYLVEYKKKQLLERQARWSSSH